MRTAQEHFDWCVKRAEEYIKAGDAQQAFSSFTIDMKNHPETENRIPLELAAIGMLEILNGPQAVHQWIKGFPRP